MVRGATMPGYGGALGQPMGRDAQDRAGALDPVGNCPPFAGDVVVLQRDHRAAMAEEDDGQPTHRATAFLF
jgi:hypothetical protein